MREAGTGRGRAELQFSCTRGLSQSCGGNQIWDSLSELSGTERQGSGRVCPCIDQSAGVSCFWGGDITSGHTASFG